MSALQTSILDRRREAELSTLVGRLFERWPALLGFCVRQDGNETLAEPFPGRLA
jgi:hypothetical protein